MVVAARKLRRKQISALSGTLNYKGDIRPLDMMTLLFGIKDVIWRPFCFQNKDTTLRQAFLSIYILYQSDEASCNILGYTKY